MGIITFDNIEIRGDLQDELEGIRIGYDGTTYTTAGDAIREQIENIYEKEYEGVVTSGNSWHQFNFVANEVYLIENTSTAASSMAMDTVPSSGSWSRADHVSSGMIAGTIVKFTPTQNMGALLIYATADGSVKISKKASIANIEAEIDDVKFHLKETQNNGYTLIDIEQNTRISRDTGESSESNGYSATGFILIPSNSLLAVDSQQGLPYSALYDENKNYISAYGLNPGYQEYFFTDKRFIRISGTNQQMKELSIKVLPSVDTSLSKVGYPADAKTVGDALKGTVGVPQYYRSYLLSKEKTIRTHHQDSEDSFIFLTDTHFSSDRFISDSPTSYFNANNSINLINHIINTTNVRQIFFGGDLLNSSTDIDQMLLCMSDFMTMFKEKNRFRYCVGNHEYYTGSDYGLTEKPTSRWLYNIGAKFNEDSIVGLDNANGTYFFDNKIQKVRYFVIPCGRDTETTIDQISWILNEFTKIPNDYNVVCIGHAFMADNMASFRGYHADIMGAMDAIKAGTSYVFNNVTYDYSNLSNVVPVCAITGHTHIDGQLITAGGIPCICVTTDSFRFNYELVDGEPVLTQRTKGTIDEQAFDVIQINFVARKIYCTRIGYGSDRVFDY